MLKNSPDQIIKDLIEDNRRKEEVIERLKWRCRNQKAEIRRLNTAHIVKNNFVDGLTARYHRLVMRNIGEDGMTVSYPARHPEVLIEDSPEVGGCCGGGSCHGS